MSTNNNSVGSPYQIGTGMGQVQLGGYTQTTPHVAPLQPLTVGDIGMFKMGGLKLPNKKISLTIHEANGGYVVTIDKGQYGEESDMYVIDVDKDLGEEIGKIITHSTLSK